MREKQTVARVVIALVGCRHGSILKGVEGYALSVTPEAYEGHVVAAKQVSGLTSLRRLGEAAAAYRCETTPLACGRALAVHRRDPVA